MLFVVGGEGGNMMGAELAALAAQEGFPLSVIGMPKSIENDLLLVDRCFGFDTAVENAQAALKKLAAQAHGEALSQLMTAWDKRDPALTAKLDAVAGRVLKK